MGIHNRHAEVFCDQDFQLGAFRGVPARKPRHGVAVHQRGNVAAHAVGSASAVGVQLSRVGDSMAGGAELGGHRVEREEVQFWQASHRAAEVDALHAARSCW